MAYAATYPAVYDGQSGSGAGGIVVIPISSLTLWSENALLDSLEVLYDSAAVTYDSLVTTYDNSTSPNPQLLPWAPNNMAQTSWSTNPLLDASLITYDAANHIYEQSDVTYDSIGSASTGSVLDTPGLTAWTVIEP